MVIRRTKKHGNDGEERHVMWVKCCLLVLMEIIPVFPDLVRDLGRSVGSRRTEMCGARFLTCNSSFELRLSGGGGFFDGNLSETHGLGRVSETLLMRERLGSNCGDPGNVDQTFLHTSIVIFSMSCCCIYPSSSTSNVACSAHVRWSEPPAAHVCNGIGFHSMRVRWTSFVKFQTLSNINYC